MVLRTCCLMCRLDVVGCSANMRIAFSMLLSKEGKCPSECRGKAQKVIARQKPGGGRTGRGSKWKEIHGTGNSVTSTRRALPILQPRTSQVLVSIFNHGQLRWTLLGTPRGLGWLCWLDWVGTGLDWTGLDGHVKQLQEMGRGINCNEAGGEQHNRCMRTCMHSSRRPTLSCCAHPIGSMRSQAIIVEVEQTAVTQEHDCSNELRHAWTALAAGR